MQFSFNSTQAEAQEDYGFGESDVDYGYGDTRAKSVSRSPPSRWSSGRNPRRCSLDASLHSMQERRSYGYGKIVYNTDNDIATTLSGSTNVSTSGSESSVDYAYGDAKAKSVSRSPPSRSSSGRNPRRCSLDASLHSMQERRSHDYGKIDYTASSSTKVSNECDVDYGYDCGSTQTNSVVRSLLPRWDSGCEPRRCSLNTSLRSFDYGDIDDAAGNATSSTRSSSKVSAAEVRQGRCTRRGSLDSTLVSPPERNSSFGSNARQARRGSVDSSSAYRPPVRRGSLGRPLRRLSVGTCIRRGSITHNDSMRSLASRESVCGSLHSVHERLARTGQNHGKLDSEMDDSSSTCGTGDASHLKPNDLDDTIADALSLDDSEQFNAGQPGPFRGTLLVAIPTVINT